MEAERHTRTAQAEPLFSELHHILSPKVVRIINMVVVAFGANLRFLAHGQTSARGKVVDLLGKEMTYYGAFIVLLTYPNQL